MRSAASGWAVAAAGLVCWAAVSKDFDVGHVYHTCQHGALDAGDEGVVLFA